MNFTINDMKSVDKDEGVKRLDVRNWNATSSAIEELYTPSWMPTSPQWPTGTSATAREKRYSYRRQYLVDGGQKGKQIGKRLSTCARKFSKGKEKLFVPVTTRFTKGLFGNYQGNLSSISENSQLFQWILYLGMSLVFARNKHTSEQHYQWNSIPNWFHIKFHMERPNSQWNGNHMEWNGMGMCFPMEFHMDSTYCN